MYLFKKISGMISISLKLSTNTFVESKGRNSNLRTLARNQFPGLQNCKELFLLFFCKKILYMYYIHTYVPKYLQCTITIYVFSRSYNLLLVYWVTIYILLVGFLQKNSQGILNRNCNSRICILFCSLLGRIWHIGSLVLQGKSLAMESKCPSNYKNIFNK